MNFHIPNLLVRKLNHWGSNDVIFFINEQISRKLPSFSTKSCSNQTQILELNFIFLDRATLEAILDISLIRKPDQTQNLSCGDDQTKSVQELQIYTMLMKCVLPHVIEL